MDHATAIRAGIDETNKKLMASVAAGDSSSIASLYTADAKLMFTGKPVIVGRENIRAAFAEILKSGVSRLNSRCKKSLLRATLSPKKAK